MSQAGANSTSGSGALVTETLTGNSGGAVPPDAAFNIDILGNNATGIDIVGTPAMNLLTVLGLPSSTTQVGTVALATDAEAIAGTVTDEAIVPSSLAAKLGIQTQYALPIGNTTAGAFNWTSAGTDGQVCIGATGANPEFAAITSTSNTITITGGPNTLNLETGSSIASSYSTDSGSAVPAAGILNIVGTAAQGITSSGAGNTVTFTVQDTSESQKGVVELATAAETTTGTSTALGVHPAGLNTKLGTQTSNGLIYGQGGAGSNLGALAEATDGQLPIGSTGNPPTLATITEGANISITNGAGSITIAANGGGSLDITALDDTDSPYTVLSSDEYLSCDVSGGVLQIEMPNAPSTGRIITVKDSGGDAASQNITVTTVGGAVNIDGATTYVMNTNYQAARFIYNGVSYEIF